MTNLLGEKIFLNKLRSLSTQTRLILSLLFLGSSVIIFIIYFYMPLNLEINKNQQLLKEYLSREEIFKKTLLESQKNYTENIILQAKYEKLIFNKNLNNNLDLILKLFKKNNLKSSSIQPQDSKNKNFYIKEYITFNAHGNFINFVSFFNDLNKYCKNLKIKYFQMESNFKKNRIELQMNLRILSFIKNGY